jgi:hypothetical protein
MIALGRCEVVANLTIRRDFSALFFAVPMKSPDKLSLQIKLHESSQEKLRSGLGNQRWALELRRVALE